MRLALRLARRAIGNTSPNPMVGAVLVKKHAIIGRGWHRRAGKPHAEIEALHDAARQGHSPKGSTLYVTLEPCCTHGRTPPCTEAIIANGIRAVVAGATDPNPAHSGRAFELLRRAGIKVQTGVLAVECESLNEAFNHWIVRRTPFVTVKAAMTLDGRIATASGESKWITGPQARQIGMQLRRRADAILVGVNTILADDPSLTLRGNAAKLVPLRRIVLDSRARTPLNARVVSDSEAGLTTIVVGEEAARGTVKALEARVKVLVAPEVAGRPRPKIDLAWLLKRLGAEHVTSLLVEGGGEANASFLMDGLAQRIAFFYAPKVLGGTNARRAVAGTGATGWNEALKLGRPSWRRAGEDLFLTARIRKS